MIDELISRFAQAVAVSLGLYCAVAAWSYIGRERRLMRNLRDIEGRELGEPAPRESVFRIQESESCQCEECTPASLRAAR